MKKRFVIVILLLLIQQLFILSSLSSPGLYAQELPCLQCHKSKNAGDITHAAVGFGCAICHLSPHEEEKPTLSLLAGSPDLCYMCHDKNSFMKEVQHTAVTAGLCTSCHNPHTGNINKLLVMEGSELCYSCHSRGIFEKKVQHTAVTAGLCTSCHDPHSSENTNVLVKTTPELCYSCHDRGNFEKEVRHTVVEAGLCTSCHDPHSSDNFIGLTQPIWDLCLSCHEGQSSGKHVTAGFGDDHPLRNKPDPGRPGRELSCTSCHAPHSSNLTSLFINEKLSPDNLCLMCHKK